MKGTRTWAMTRRETGAVTMRKGGAGRASVRIRFPFLLRELSHSTFDNPADKNRGNTSVVVNGEARVHTSATSGVSVLSRPTSNIRASIILRCSAADCGLGGQQGEEEGSCIMTTMARGACGGRQRTDQKWKFAAAFGLTALSPSFVVQKTNCPPSP